MYNFNENSFWQYLTAQTCEHSQSSFFSVFKYFDTTATLLLHPFNSLFYRTTCVSRYKKDKTSLDLDEARDDRVLGYSGISWTICKQAAPRSRQITTPTPHHSILQAFLTPNQQCQSTGRCFDTATRCYNKIRTQTC